MSSYIITLLLCLLVNYGFARRELQTLNGTKDGKNNTIVQSCLGCYVDYAKDSPLEAGRTSSRGCVISGGYWISFQVVLQLKENRIADTWEVSIGCHSQPFVDKWQGGYNSVFYFNMEDVPPRQNEGVCYVSVKNTNWFFSQQYNGHFCITPYEQKYYNNTVEQNRKNHTLIDLHNIQTSATNRVPWSGIYIMIISFIALIIGIIVVVLYRRRKRSSYNNIV